MNINELFKTEIANCQTEKIDKKARRENFVNHAKNTCVTFYDLCALIGVWEYEFPLNGKLLKDVFGEGKGGDFDNVVKNEIKAIQLTCIDLTHNASHNTQECNKARKSALRKSILEVFAVFRIPETSISKLTNSKINELGIRATKYGTVKGRRGETLVPCYTFLQWILDSFVVNTDFDNMIAVNMAKLVKSNDKIKNNGNFITYQAKLAEQAQTKQAEQAETEQAETEQAETEQAEQA